MTLFKLKTNLTLLHKICLTGLFIALAAILQKVLAVNYLSISPWMRISFGGPALIVFSSVLLGPFFGAAVGAGSDLLGYFVFDMSGKAFFPQVTAIYTLLGFCGYFVFQLVKLIKSKTAIICIEAILFTALLGGGTWFLVTRNVIDLWIKIVAPIILGLLFVGLMTFIIFYDKKATIPLGYNAYQISLCAFLLDIFVLVGFGSLMKGLAFGMDLYPVIVICQAIVMFFNVTISTIVLSILFNVCKKYFSYENISRGE